MSAERALSASLGQVLADEMGAEGSGMVVRAGLTRRRSSLYFLGPADDTSAVRWVVKQPNDGSEQVDLSSPLSAADQFQALQRLHQHLLKCEGALASPRPVAYLADIGAYVMEYVPGPTLTELIRPSAIPRPGALLRGVTDAARLLRAVHSLEPPEACLVDMAELHERARTRGRGFLEGVGLPSRDHWVAAGRPADARVPGSKVLLHGDFAPENVLLSAAGPYCLEPDLSDRDWAEHDVARFLLMLFDAPMFVTGADLLPVQGLRRRAAAAFMTAYYGGSVWPDALRPLMLLGLSARWATRHTDVVERAPRFGKSRTMLLRRYFGRLLDEVSSPAWPGSYRRPR